MTVEMSVEPHASIADAWTVETIGKDGEIYQAIFVGPKAEDRARSYADLIIMQPQH